MTKRDRIKRNRRVIAAAAGSLFAAGMVIGAASAGQGDAAEGETAAGGSAVKAWIELEERPGGITIQGFCDADEPMKLRYEMVSRKTGKSGTNNTRQGGNVELDGESASGLSRVGLGVAPGDHYSVELRILDDGDVVAEAHVDYPPGNGETAPEEDVEGGVDL